METIKLGQLAEIFSGVSVSQRESSKKGTKVKYNVYKTNSIDRHTLYAKDYMTLRKGDILLHTQTLDVIRIDTTKPNYVAANCFWVLRSRDIKLSKWIEIQLRSQPILNRLKDSLDAKREPTKFLRKNDIVNIELLYTQDDDLMNDFVVSYEQYEKVIKEKELEIEELKEELVWMIHMKQKHGSQL